MPPEERQIARFAAEPPQDLLPYGRWAATLREAFLEAAESIEVDPEDGEIGEPQSMVWFPDRSWNGRTYVPASTRTTTGLEVFGYVSYERGEEGEPLDFQAMADYTAETADNNPEWKLDLSEEVIGSWRGEQGNVAAMTLVWGLPLIPAGAVVTAELAALVVDQCVLQEDRFTLIAPDDYRGDFLDIVLFDKKGGELARESLYEEDGEDDEEDEAPE